MRIPIRSILVAAAFAGLSAATASAQMALPRTMTLGKESRIWVDGTSNVKSFSCSAGKMEVTVVAAPGANPSALVQTASLLIPVAAMDCKNETMNGHMRKALKAKDNPQIAWKMSSYTIEGSNVALSGKLTIAGKENPLELRATGTVSDNGTIHVKGTKQFRMTEFGVKPPSLMFGTMKVGDPITVSFDLVLNN